MTRPYLIDIPQISDPRGNLSFLESNGILPFEIQRVFWTYNVPSGERRGGHAFKTQTEVIIALSGAVDIVTVDQTDTKVVFRLDRPNKALFLPAKTWRRMEYFSGNAFCLHLCDSKFNDGDYDREDRE